MKSLEEIYGPKFFAKRHKLQWRAEIVCKAIINALEPESVIDVGCATGDYVHYFNSLGIKALGIEGSSAVLPYALTDKIVICDMRKREIVRENSDLLTCFEVLEHIEEEYSDIFVENLTKLSDRILVSAAPPGSGGHYHVNCQPKKYWIEKFMVHNYGYDEVITCLVKAGLKPWIHRKELYHNNLMYFGKGENHV
ncbi:MAG: class I SAM-dependent methyltransferase [Candidatus Thorarchaeota archaeon]|jgi:hypothetical protein